MNNLMSHESLFSLACLMGDTETLHHLIKKADEKQLQEFSHDLIIMLENDSLDSTALNTLNTITHSLSHKVWSIISAQNSTGQTALHSAAQHNRIDILKLFFPLPIILGQEDDEQTREHIENMLNLIALQDNTHKRAIDKSLENKNSDFARILNRIEDSLKKLKKLEDIIYFSCGQRNVRNTDYVELLQARQRIEELTKNNGPLASLV